MNEDLNALHVTGGKDQLGPEPEQPVLVGLFLNKSQPSDLALHDQLKKLVQTFLPVIHTRTEVTNDLGTPAFGGTVGFKQLLLPVKIVFLVVAGYTAIAQCRGGFVRKAH